MLKEETIALFDEKCIRLGDMVRFTRLGSQKQPRLALVQAVTPDRLTVVYCNQQSGKVTYQTLTAKDVSVGIYALEWPHDLHQREDRPEDDLPDLENTEEDLEADLPEVEDPNLDAEEVSGEGMP